MEKEMTERLNGHLFTAFVLLLMGRYFTLTPESDPISTWLLTVWSSDFFGKPAERWTLLRPTTSTQPLVPLVPLPFTTPRKKIYGPGVKYA